MVAITLPPGEPEVQTWRSAPLAELVATIDLAAGPVIGRPRIVAVDGRGASGKSTLADRLALDRSRSAVLHTDDIAWQETFFQWMELLATGVLEPARSGSAVSFRPPAWAEYGRKGALEFPTGLDLLVVEGVGAGCRALAPLLDAVVWVQSDFVEAERRGIARDIAMGVNGDEQETTAFWHEWMAAELTFLADDRPWERACAIVAGTPADPGHVLMANGPL